MTYDCMSPDELTLWRDSRYAPATAPCVDCPMWFHLQEKAAGRCDRRPTPNGGGQPVSEARREQLRAASRAYRRRQRHIEMSQRYRVRLRAQVAEVRARRRVQ